jgi:hypothetical protein
MASTDGVIAPVEPLGAAGADKPHWLVPVLALTGVLLTVGLYGWSAAPGLTWAHQGADGGELLAAAQTNGVPHPPGYPLYMLLLRGWLAAGQWLRPESELARLGNLLSATCAALSVGVTILCVARLLRGRPYRLWWAALAGAAWAISPLLWSQALVTEVYALHALFVALLGWTLVEPKATRLLPLVIAGGVAHHLTFVLLLPAVFYLLWVNEGADLPAAQRTGGRMGVGVLLGLLFYLRTPLAAGATPPPPVNWGYADNWAGFWWLVSGAAYRGYLFSGAAGDLLGRLTRWAYIITEQYTPVGLGIALIGLANWDRQQPRLRNFSILWIVPVSIYAIGYYTRDSEIYLLSVAWLMALWLAVGLDELAGWLRVRWARQWAVLGLSSLLVLGLGLLLALRLPSLTLRQDQAARTFVTAAASVLEPGSIVLSLEDNQTFALWYGAWGSGELSKAAPGLVVINYSLYQFDWYRRLLRERYPEVVTDQQRVEEILNEQHASRPIFFSEPLSYFSTEQLSPDGVLWRYTPE